MNYNYFGKNIVMFFCIIFSLLPWAILANTYQKKTLKILMVVAAFPKIHDICMLNQITGLLDRGHDVRIYALRRGDFINVQEDVIKYNLLSRTMFFLPFNSNDYDIVMFQLGHKVFNIKKTHNFKGKVVVCMRGYDITGFLRANPHAYDEYFNLCDLFMPVCQAFKKILQQAGCSEEKIAVVHSSIDCSKFTFKVRQLPQSGVINIISAGRFVEKKGFEYSIRAIAQLIKKYPKIKYTIIGEGPLEKEYKKLIKRLGVQNNITLHPWYKHQDYIQILNRAHIFIAPSITAHNNDQEGIPNVLKEAMAMGLVVVATNYSGNPELIENGVSGLLVPERDSHAIYRALEYILSNSKSWLSMQLAAVKKIHDEFEKEKENDKLEAILYSLVDL